MGDTVRLSPYDPLWATFFWQERSMLLAAAGSSVAGLEHVGSSAVPHLVSRPSIDILIGTRSYVLDAALDGVLAGLGYQCIGQGSDQIRRFARVDEDRGIAYHLHLVTFDGPEWRCCLAIRDYLRQHPEEVTRYVLLKEVIAPWGGALYRKSKMLFFLSILDSVEETP
jgi:GrpB-like predicted nucleotidyltransferase (UPF0157 family)